MFNKSPTQNIFKILIFTIVFLLVFSFLLHDLVPHHHSVEIFGGGLKAFFHSSEKKWLFLVFFIVFVFNVLKGKLSSVEMRRVFSCNFLYWRTDLTKIFNPVLQALRIGIINSKLYN
ncbi:hypothetical protein K8Q98_02675 [Candidatus Nomurabacteria bacterium]|nr:hypothetical protein [Candidatus Nomurabacteria bacterium]